MTREELLLLLSFLLVLEGYLGENTAPAVLGFFIPLYLLAVKRRVSFQIGGGFEAPKSLEEGRWGKVLLKVRNGGRNARVNVGLNTGGLEVEEPGEVFLSQGEEIEIELRIRAHSKGEFSVGPVKVRAEDERGLYFEDFTLGEEVKLPVYPSVEAIKEAVRSDHNIRLAEMYRRSQFLGSESMEIKELREFQHGDDFKRIDWKASMRLGELIVREMLREEEADVYIFVDNGREMRKGIERAKIDYAATLALQLASNLIKSYRIGMVIYDEENADFLKASRGAAQLGRMRQKLAIRREKKEMSLKFGLQVAVSERAREFLRKVFPLRKGRRGSKGVFEGLSLVKQPSILIFISDLSNPSDLYRAIASARRIHRVLLLSPNPVLFYSKELDEETLKRLYRAYLERERLIKRFGSLVPTLDLGPSDYINEIARVM
ncbi:DUF58 domain-containing protein [Palaeococcus ferrophilus]|uniref:DUF58 domain-containing protein n=1 Tax=Palaeococcus ferrophilus TaxID=83868 RepID=UPI00064FC46D|nr:DUF58 domain-containing protein [Palaeococcus ferrophilus]